jgi:predicted small lipoprotein YifL
VYRSCCALLILIASTGCGGSGPTYVPVTGTVKYADGTVPTGDVATITFQPDASEPDTKAASGTIKPDGSFALQTINPGDGARPGDYAVTVHVMKGYPAGKSLVASRYTKPATTPLKAPVTEDGENHFDFIVERP